MLITWHYVPMMCANGDEEETGLNGSSGFYLQHSPDSNAPPNRPSQSGQRAHPAACCCSTPNDFFLKRKKKLLRRVLAADSDREPAPKCIRFLSCAPRVQASDAGKSRSRMVAWQCQCRPNGSAHLHKHDLDRYSRRVW